jgi:hypothetical protein
MIPRDADAWILFLYLLGAGLVIGGAWIGTWWIFVPGLLSVAAAFVVLFRDEARERSGR